MCQADGTPLDRFLCDEGTLGAISYSEFVGIMLGMLCFGAIADAVGHNRAGMLTSILMVAGVTIMTFVESEQTDTLFLVFAVFFGIFGLGVGGEYPLSASGAASHHAKSLEDAEMDTEERRQVRIIMDHERTIRRGETISLVFAMQGVGAVFGSTILLFLIFFSGQERSEW